MSAAVPLIIMGVGTLMAASSKYQQGAAESEAYKYNARITEGEAAAVKEKAEYDVALHEKDVRRLIGEQRARYAKAGVDISSGSPLFIMAATAAEGKEEEELIMYEGDVESTRLRNQARMQRYYAKQAKRAGTMGAISTLFSGAGSMYGASLQSGAATSGGGSLSGAGASRR